jgi:arylamine N-acetyltransferase
MKQARTEPPLKEYQAQALRYLEVPSHLTTSAPSVRSLNRLIQAYLNKVPWESFSRIVKRQTTLNRAECPRWPEEFWADARSRGSGGTCFENTYAFFDLLSALGYNGYLTVNDMGTTRGCHAAIVLLLDGHSYLVDATIPIPCALPLPRGEWMRRSALFHTYTIRRSTERYEAERYQAQRYEAQRYEAERYEVERSHHPKRNIYTLIDHPVTDDAYRNVVEQDYGADGLFLDRAVIVKAKGSRLWRFSSLDLPYRIEIFDRGGKHEIALPVETLAIDLARAFEMDAGLIASAMTHLQIP